MTAFVITYDLKAPGRSYAELYKRIKSYGTWCHPVESTWFIVSNTNDCAEICDYLSPALDKNDSLIVAKPTGDAAWMGLSEVASKWIKESF